eukprot:CCRYP_001001-RA/>CCRYP_001001-RA protein AED:0.48 eAED:0.48 QI:25/1/0.5/1/0/0/2/0/61
MLCYGSVMLMLLPRFCSCGLFFRSEPFRMNCAAEEIQVQKESPSFLLYLFLVYFMKLVARL